MAEASTTVPLPIVACDSEPAASETSTVPSTVIPSLVLPDDGPVPLSFPAILRNPKLIDRYAHLREHSVAAPPKTSISKARRDEHEGKRWIRRRENAKFTNNPHVVPPSRGDHAVPVPSRLSTFPIPLPPYLPRSIVLPSSVPGSRDPASASAGLFSLSLKGARRALRARPGARDIVDAIEGHLCAWLEGGTYPGEEQGIIFPGEKVGGREDVLEVSRRPLDLVWVVGKDGADGAFERYVVHCLARWYGVVSFSKEVNGKRLTYLLRPQVTQVTASIIDTPPATDISQVDTESDFVSDIHTSDLESDLTSDMEHEAHTGELSAISEAPSSPAAWSVIGGSDFEFDEGFAASVESLSLDAEANDLERTPRAADVRGSGGVYVRNARTRFSAWNEPRSGSSPSRSPARRLPPTRRAMKQQGKKSGRKSGKGTFYDYLFA
ncbi:uncharacterized protein HD556DRAFT_1429579 [Suillus plorans]|uniref:R3H-associated N-terminal domain-containing protein n=1 Tax=Suillus plorans TaxID=116603 RepID=A0A9P7DTX6_9AGAM|nr:uncharacterized protein HD556DRAFT_1429579 [Suillus plorans]KAG1802839.1 hypothetical protein HD556DRAFT_1429579 [Suillus plorans]